MRAALVALAALGVSLVGVPAAAATPAAPEDLCTVTDSRLTELSGLAVHDGEIWAMADGGRRVTVYRLDPADCAVVDTRTAELDPFDAEDLAVAPDGTFWVADTGDNNRARETVALLVVPPRDPPRLHRLVYPDGAHDAEAVLLGADGVPVVVTKEVTGIAGVYRPDGPLAEPGPTPLRRVGSVGFARSETRGGPIGALGAFTVTGGAVSPDGRVVAVRTYTDAWLYRVPPSGDLVAALQTTPLQVPLPDEPQGEAIAFLPDGTLLSGSEARGRDGRLRAVPGAVDAALAAAPPVPTPPPPAAAPPEPAPEWRPAVIGGGVAVVVLGLAAGALALHTRRR
ncbi:hypothetical protein [Pseudonocardia sp. WMMC193]|uniref:hypothetical protein n=1 Tax=Pseudonocardia sp. WMMC193 TaxID=2911965 RepID=UPI001F15E7F8|nr:hypothetical protein [Pseudonocardia sp. WMMC193]MCF7549986.1 hypothetical protein [Pseudonocardia sp. WMMC193]